MKTLLFLALLCVKAYGDAASDFCANGPPGLYCNDDLSGYYWCTGAQSFNQPCPPGTQCNCFHGPECSSVETIGNGSPCGFVPVLPNYPNAFTATRETTTTITHPGGSQTSTTTQLYQFDRYSGRLRIDTETETSSYTDLFTNGYHYRIEGASCTTLSDYIAVGVPNGYQLLESDATTGVDTYYYRNGGQNNGQSTIYGEIEVNSAKQPISEYYRFNGGPSNPTSTVSETAWSNFVFGAPDGSVFAVPSNCPQ
eukprot:TRINITY_DN49_c0_g1_i1.p1 TRINITY_DN49_c0_g1~~TRINITY_DN49_c0_g1_i1.p1  ORF type:complete len:276 (-),score=64.66 TRINITY_DN49_c0_g1_i1:110-868(-)